MLANGIRTACIQSVRRHAHPDAAPVHVGGHICSDIELHKLAVLSGFRRSTRDLRVHVPSDADTIATASTDLLSLADRLRDLELVIASESDLDQFITTLVETWDLLGASPLPSLDRITIRVPVTTMNRYVCTGSLQQIFPHITSMTLASIAPNSGLPGLADLNLLRSRGPTLEVLNVIFLMIHNDLKTASSFIQELIARLPTWPTTARIIFRLNIAPDVLSLDESTNPNAAKLLSSLRQLLHTTNSIVQLRLGDGGRNWVFNELSALASRPKSFMIETTDNLHVLDSTVQSVKAMLLANHSTPSLCSLKRVKLWVCRDQSRRGMARHAAITLVRRELLDICTSRRVVIQIQFSRI
ncbi:hypothetical protein BKA62DRAFT_710806 [Auriculariales sp. MPI-PUGE-AT-0066]|nr:hypothetical protein BKA62DRAFT_710806 [Auriculariales sp. MPI-PUGE-AT-0066]